MRVPVLYIIVFSFCFVQLNYFVIYLIIKRIISRWIHLLAVDGQWTSWGSYGSCTVTCGGGSQSRSRSCTNPAPLYGGASCAGSSSSSQACNTHNCPSKSIVCLFLFCFFQLFFFSSNCNFYSIFLK